MTDETKEAVQDALKDLEAKERRDYERYREWCEPIGAEPAELQRWRALRCRS